MKNVIPVSSAEANGSGFILEQFLTNTNVLPGTQFVIRSHMTGTGMTHQSSNLEIDSQNYVSYFSLSAGGTSGGNQGRGTCIGDGNGNGLGLDGTAIMTCTTMFLLSPNVEVDYYISGLGFVGTTGGSVTFDSSHTASIDAAYAIDSLGNILPDVQIYDSSGIDHNHPSIEATVPEPRTWALSAAGILLFLAVSRSRQRAA